MTHQANRVECRSTAVFRLSVKPLRHLKREKKKNTERLNIDRGVWIRDAEVSEITGNRKSSFS